MSWPGDYMFELQQLPVDSLRWETVAVRREFDENMRKLIISTIGRGVAAVRVVRCFPMDKNDPFSKTLNKDVVFYRDGE